MTNTCRNARVDIHGVRDTSEPQLRRPGGFAAVGVSVVALSVFAATLAPTVTSEDSGELIAAAWSFGVPHPPGYPIWTLLNGLFARLVPVGPVAFRTNLCSALCSSVAAVVLYGALRTLRFTQLAAASVALVWVFGRWSWSQSVITEVYSLNSLFTAAVLWCGLRWYCLRRLRYLMYASLLLGLGMTNHHVIALVGLAMTIWILTLAPGLLRRVRLIAVCVALFLAGLLPYVYLPVRAAASPSMNWGDPSTLDRFWAHVSRRQYGAVGPTRVAEPRSAARLSRQLRYVAASVADDLTPILAVASIAGFVLMLRRNRATALLAVLWLGATGGLFAVLANFDLDPTSQWVMRVFLIPVSMALAPGLACLIDFLSDAVHRLRAKNRDWLGSSVRVCLALAGPIVLLVAHWHECNYSRYWYARDHARTSRATPLAGLEHAVEAFDLAQTAAERWRVSTEDDRRAILERVLLNRTLFATSLVTTKRKPFDVLAEGPILQQSRGERRWW